MIAEEDTLYTKLPIEERCVHKLWKARLSGYEEAIHLFGQLDNKSQEWNKFIGIIKKFVIDSNAVAQEKGLEATLIFVENATIAGRTTGDIMTGLISKCYGAPKSKTRDIAVQITLMFIEIEKQDIVIEELIKGMDHKFPKIVTTCIKAVTQSIKDFGSKVINIKLILNKLQSILEVKDKSARDEAKLLALELYSWIGPASVKANLANSKPLQIQELDAEFGKMNGDKPRPTRYLRSQQEQATKIKEVVPVIGDVLLEEVTDEVDDPEEHIDPVNILFQLNKNFYEKLEAKKWQERKEAIDMLEGLLFKAPKLESGEYGDLVRALKKIITKDTNVIIVGIAAKCITMLANGLKKRFETYASACMPALLEKFKEKKTNVVLPLRDAVDAIYLNMTLDSIHEDILTAINNKNPSVKAESVSFLARCFTKCTPKMLNKHFLNVFTTVLIKTLNESDPTVRDNSAEALGTAWKVVSEKNILPFLNGIDAIKLAKIKEASEKAIITAKLPTVVINPASDSSNNVEKKVTSITNKSTAKKNHTAVNSKTTAKSKAKKPKNTLGGRKQLNAHLEIDNEKEIGDEELEEIALTFCSPEIISGMVDANWKIRLSNVQQFAQIINQTEALSISSQVLIKLLNKKPGIKDNNVQIQKLRLECLKTIIEKFPISNTSMGCCIQDVCSLLGDKKNGSLVGEVLTTFAESTRLDLVSTLVLEYAFTVQKNCKVQIDALNWLSGAIQKFGFIIEPKSLMQNVKKALGASNSQVRMTVISLLGVMYLYMGPQLNLFFENEKPSLVQQINAEFEKHQGEVPPIPTLGKKNKSIKCADVTSDDEKPAFEVNIREIVPRIDITPQITDALINEFSDRDWKIRSDAITKLHNIITEAKFITNELGEAKKALQNRIIDSNARLGSNAINLVELISKAMGSSFKNYIKVYLPSVLNSLGDSKTFKCQSALQCMNTWVDVCGYREFFGSDMLLAAFNNNSVSLQTALWTWLAEHLPLMPLKIIPADELKCLLPVLYNSLEDRHASVRIASEKAVLGFMIHLGYATMYGACEKLKPMSIKLCREKLDRERPNLPIVVPIEKLKSKSNISVESSLKSKGSKTHPKMSSKVHKENVSHRANATTIKKKEDIDNGGLLFQQNNLKHQRDIDEHKLKALKWNFTTPRDEFVEQLREQMITAGVNKLLIKYMFDSNFLFHLKAIYILSEDLNTTNDDNLALINNLDLILKWMTLRFFDTNPSVLLKGLDYLQHVFEILIAKKYILHDTEVQSFVPYLVTKLGDPKDSVRSNVKAILKQIAFIFPITKLFHYIMDGIKSKNSRQRSECLEHIASMIENYGTSIFHPSITVVLREIAKSISDRDNSARMSALNCFVAVHLLLGDALFKLVGNLSEKDMGLLKERLKRVSKKPSVSVVTIQPTTKIALSPVQQIPDTEEIVDNDNSDGEQYNATYRVLQESNHEQSPVKDSNNSPSRLLSTTTTALNLSSLEMSLRNVIDKPQMTRFSLNEKLLQELDAEVITKPVLVLKPYVWNSDLDKKRTPEKLHIFPNNNPSSKPCLNVSPFTSSTTILKYPRTQPIPINQVVDPFQTIIKHISSQDIETLKLATNNVTKMLFIPQMKLNLLKDGKFVLIFHAIINQFSILCISYNDIIDFTQRSKIIFGLCLNLLKCREIKILMNKEIISGLLTKLLFLLNMNKQKNTPDTNNFDRCVNSLLMNILDPPTPPTPLICALLALLYSTVKYPQNYTTHYKELVMKCIWKLVKDFHKWESNEIHVDIVLAKIYTFLKEFDFNYWKNQPSNNEMKTYKTVLYTLVKAHSDKVLTCLAISEYPANSDMVVYIHQLLKHLKRKHANTQ